MHISLRRLIFAFFVLVFLISAPLVVLHTAGYRLNISNRRLLQTGVLAITTFPRGAGITLDDLSLAQKSPFVVQRIMPSTHSVVLKKKGYHDWSQRVRIEEGKTSYINARLFAKVEPTELNATDAALALRSKKDLAQPTPDDASVNFLDNGANVEVRAGNEPNSQLIALLPLGTYRLLEEDTEYILIANERDMAFVVARQGGDVVELPTKIVAFDWLANENLLIWTDGTEVNIYDVLNGENTFITRDGRSITDVVWHPSADSFFVATSAGIDAFDRAVYETREIVSLLSSPNIADIWLDAGGKNLYFILTPTAPNTTEPQPTFQLPLTI